MVVEASDRLQRGKEVLSHVHESPFDADLPVMHQIHPHRRGAGRADPDHRGQPALGHQVDRLGKGPLPGDAVEHDVRRSA
jgi:hypothetical protein